MMKHLLFATLIAGVGLSALADILEWNGPAGTPAKWSTNLEDRVWLNDAKESVPWKNGAMAHFRAENTPASIQMTDGVVVGGLYGEKPLTILGAPFTITDGILLRQESKTDIRADLHAPYGLLIQNNTFIELEHTGFLSPTQETVVFENISLSEIKTINGYLNGSAVDDPASGYHFRYDPQEGTATVQLQMFYPPYIKCVIVRLREEGNKIFAQPIQAKFIESNHASDLGSDFFEIGNSVNIASSPTDGGYGVKTIRAVPFDQDTPSVSFNGNCTIGNSLFIAAGTTLHVGQDAIINGGKLDFDISNDGTFIYESDTTHSLLNDMDGVGKLVIATHAEPYTTLCENTGFIGAPGTEARFKNVKIDTVCSVVGELAGPAISPGETHMATPFHLRRVDADTITIQLQIIDKPWDAHLKCVKVQLKQEGNDLVATPIFAGYVLSNKPDHAKDYYLGSDFDRYDHNHITNKTYPSQDPNNGYGVRNFGILTRSGLIVEPGVKNTYDGGTLVRSGLLKVNDPYALPYNKGCMVEVEPPGVLRLNYNTQAENLPGGWGPANQLWIKGLLDLQSSWTIGRHKNILIDGGFIRFAKLWRDDSCVYMNLIQLQNGARIIGEKPRCGWTYPAITTVTGTIPSTNEVGMLLFRDNQTMESDPETQLYTIQVEDVTASPEPDYVMSGSILDTPLYVDRNIWPGLKIKKQGPGTLLYTAHNTYTGDTQIVEGTLALGDPQSLTKSKVVLLGGRLEVRADETEAFQLQVAEENSELDLCDAGGISFQNSADQAWPGSLLIRGDLKNSSGVRFGTGPNGLTTEQLRKIRYEVPGSGKLRSVSLDSQGWLTLNPESTLLLLK